MNDRRVGLAVILTLTITLFALWFGGAFTSSGKASVGQRVTTTKCAQQRRLAVANGAVQLSPEVEAAKVTGLGDGATAGPGEHDSACPAHGTILSDPEGNFIGGWLTVQNLGDCPLTVTVLDVKGKDLGQGGALGGGDNSQGFRLRGASRVTWSCDQGTECKFIWSFRETH